MSERNEFSCAARGCDGCTICEPIVSVMDNHPYPDLLASKVYALQAENAQLREALGEILEFAHISMRDATWVEERARAALD